MKSYPSTFNYGGANMVIQGSINKDVSQYNITKNTRNNSFDVSRIKSANINSGSFVKQQLLNPSNINIAGFDSRPAMNNLDASSTGQSHNYSDTFYTGGIQRATVYENPLNITASNIRSMNNYRLLYVNKLKSIVDVGKVNNDEIEALIGNTASVASMFNPVNNVQVLGLCGNVPLLNSVASNKRSYDVNITDCSIRRLVWASLHNTTPSLGNAKYRYADFMYCKDLGKVSNNHLITLRRFPLPVGDNIFETSSPKYTKGSPYNFEQFGAMGTLISWFGTEDNKLEDILNFSYQATWRPLSAKIEPIDSNEENSPRGIIGMFANSINPQYNQMVADGFAGEHSIFGWLGTELKKFNITHANRTNSDSTGILRNYDNNKVYEPKNTVQDTHIYERKLQFTHEFTLTFSYKLRAYDAINPKSAFIDLIGNILEVTYRRGKFWGGDRKWIGPPKNTSTWNKANAFIDEYWEKLGGMMTGLLSGSIDFGNIMSTIAGAVSEGVGALVNGVQNAMSGGMNELAKNLMAGAIKLNKTTGFSKGLKGLLKNALGRPALYAMDSLLSGDDVGVWHVTIGNPFNPIAAIGNLILTDSSISFSGPLGIDDFPTEIKVKVSLKHGRSRDAVEIGRMFTRGESAIYMPTANHKLSDYFYFAGNAEEQMDKARKDDRDNIAATAKKIETTMYKKEGDGMVPEEITADAYDKLSDEDKKSYKQFTKVDSYGGVSGDHLETLMKSQTMQSADIPENNASVYYPTAITTENECMQYFGHFTLLGMREAIDEIA